MLTATFRIRISPLLRHVVSRLLRYLVSSKRGAECQISVIRYVVGVIRDVVVSMIRIVKSQGTLKFYTKYDTDCRSSKGV